MIQNDPTIGDTGDRERETTGHVGLDEASHNVDTRSLRCQHQVDARRASKLSDSNDRVFNIPWRNHHEVGELVDDDEQVRIRTQDALAARRQHNRVIDHSRVEVVDVPKAEAGQIVVAHIHLFDDPLQRFGCLLRIRDDGRNEVGNAGVGRQFDALRIDEHKAHLLRCGAHKNTRDHGVNEAGLARTGRTGDK